MSRTLLAIASVPGGLQTVEDLGASTGSRFFVHSGTGTDAAGFGAHPDKPVATLDYAIGLCTASKGDVIYVMPGHAESFTAADGFDVDVAGVKIVGLGWGAQRGTFTFADTDADVAIGANGVWLENLRFIAGISAVVRGINVEGKTDVTIKGCDFIQGSTTGFDFVDTLILAAGSHRATIEGNRFLAEPAVAGAATAIKLSGASNNVRVYRNEFMGDFSTSNINGITTLSQGLMVLDNLVHNTDAGEPYLEVLTGTTGVIAGTRGLASGATVAANAVADAMAHCENFVVNTAGTIAIVKGAGGSPALDAD